MKIDFQKLMRVLPSLISVVVIISFCCVPAFAAPIEESIWDYAEVKVNGFTKEVTVRFPDQLTEITLIGDNWTVLEQERGNDSTFDLTGYPSTMRVYFSPLGQWFKPFGSTLYDGMALNLGDIPDGATFTVSTSAWVNPQDNGTGNLFMAWYNDGYVDSATGVLDDRKEISMTLTHPESSLWKAVYEGTFRDTGKLYACQVEFAFQTNASGRWTFNLDDFVINTSIDALKQLESNTNRTNELLEEIREQNNINQQNWQDFLDGKAEWQDIVDSSTDKVEDAVGDMNDIGDALATIPKPEIDIETLVPEELAGQQYLNYTAALSRLWENPIISTVAYIMGCLLIFSYLLFGERG